MDKSVNNPPRGLDKICVLLLLLCYFFHTSAQSAPALQPKANIFQAIAMPEDMPEWPDGSQSLVQITRTLQTQKHFQLFQYLTLKYNILKYNITRALRVSTPSAVSGQKSALLGLLSLLVKFDLEA